MVPHQIDREIARALAPGPVVQMVEAKEIFGFARSMSSAKVLIVVRLLGPWFLNGPAYGDDSRSAFAWRCKLEFKDMEAVVGITAQSRLVLKQVIVRLNNPPQNTAVFRIQSTSATALPIDVYRT